MTSGIRFTPQRTVEGWDNERRTVRNTMCTDPGFDIYQYEPVEYLCGDRVDTHSGLAWQNFDWVQPIKESANPKNGKSFFHFLCHRDRVATIVIAVKK